MVSGGVCVQQPRHRPKEKNRCDPHMSPRKLQLVGAQDWPAVKGVGEADVLCLSTGSSLPVAVDLESTAINLILVNSRQ